MESLNWSDESDSSNHGEESNNSNVDRKPSQIEEGIPIAFDSTNKKNEDCNETALILNCRKDDDKSIDPNSSGGSSNAESGYLTEVSDYESAVSQGRQSIC